MFRILSARKATRTEASRRGIPPHSRPTLSVLNDHWQVIGPAGKDPLSLRRVDARRHLRRRCCGFAWPRHVDRHQQTGAQQQSRKIVRRPRRMGGVGGRDGNRENWGEKNRPRHSRDGAKRIDRPLQFSLRRGINMPRHQRLHGRSRDSPERNKRNDCKHHPPAAAKSETREADGAKEQAGKQATPFAKTLYKRTDEHAGNYCRAYPDNREGETDVAPAPRIAILRIKRPHRRKRVVSEVVERRRHGKSCKFTIRAE